MPFSYIKHNRRASLDPKDYKFQMGILSKNEAVKERRRETQSGRHSGF